MQDDDFLKKWLPLETRFRAIEETYRVERIRHNGHPFPEGAQLAELRNDISATVDLYMAATAEQRGIMRDLFEWSYLLPNYIGVRLPKDLPDEEAVKSLRRSLAAASLENNKMDFRDTFVLLGAIWIEFDRRSIDPRPYFDEAAGWSSVSMRRFFHDFRKSAYFKCDVAPKLILRK